MKTHIAGIPCFIGEIEINGSYSPAKVNADPDSCYDAEYPEVAYQVQDRRGRPAPWLERKLTDADRARLYEEVLRDAEESMHD